ncbi:MAG: hypothetical protein CV082_01175 [Candidatus Brocadia sp. BL1]|nr:MAG: hypothetical protein CV082_01175 [Candidatus Brocadia sp. BL1]
MHPGKKAVIFFANVCCSSGFTKSIVNTGGISNVFYAALSTLKSTRDPYVLHPLPVKMRKKGDVLFR